MAQLANETCVRVARSAARLSAAECDGLAANVPDWRRATVDGIERLERVFRFPDFATALAFGERVGALADAQDHHPALLIEWGRATVSWWTHVVAGLHRNDFVMAARTDRLYSAFRTGASV